MNAEQQLFRPKPHGSLPAGCTPDLQLFKVSAHVADPCYSVGHNRGRMIFSSLGNQSPKIVWTCMSHRPGITNLALPSTTCAPFSGFAFALAVIAEMRSPVITTAMLRSREPSFTLTTVAWSMTSACSAASAEPAVPATINEHSNAHASQRSAVRRSACSRGNWREQVFIGPALYVPRQLLRTALRSLEPIGPASGSVVCDNGSTNSEVSTVYPARIRDVGLLASVRLCSAEGVTLL